LLAARGRAGSSIVFREADPPLLSAIVAAGVDRGDRYEAKRNADEVSALG